jgi:hypothetical protein
MATITFPSPTQLKNISTPSVSSDAATKGYVDSIISGGGTFSTGDISASGNISITGNLTVGGTTNLGPVGNVKITGGTADYVLKTDGTGNLSWIAQSIGTLTATADQFSANGTDTTFTLSVTPVSKAFTVVAIQGVLQPKSCYSLSGPQLTFDFSPPVSAIIEVTTFAGSVVSGSNSAMTWNIASSNITMAANNGYFVDTSVAAKTMTLPSSATLGDTIRINDLAGSFSTNNLTVARNGHKIQGSANDLLVDVDQTSFGLVYSNSTYGWKVLEL